VVGDLINQIEISTLLTAEEKEDLRNKNRKGSINQLECFLKREYPNLSLELIDRLRNIMRIRSGFPVHSSEKEFLKACEDLGIKLPMENWNGCWQKILYWFWWSLHELRITIQHPK